MRVVCVYVYVLVFVYVLWFVFVYVLLFVFEFEAPPELSRAVEALALLLVRESSNARERESPIERRRRPDIRCGRSRKEPVRGSVAIWREQSVWGVVVQNGFQIITRYRVILSNNIQR